MRSWHTYACIAAVLASVVFLAVLLQQWRLDVQSTFFKESLGDAGVEESVEVEGSRYLVRGSDVYDSSGLLLEKQAVPLRAYVLAYERALARRSPILAIPGTDTDKLKEAALDLLENQRKLGSLQEDVATGELVSSSLYPVKFLEALSNAEAARRAFLRTGSDVSAQEYTRALMRAINSYESDARALTHAIETVVRKDRKFVVLAGSIDLKSMSAALASVAERASFMRQKLVERSACASGMLALCAPEDLALPAIEIALPQTASSSLSLTNEVVSLLSEAYYGAPLRQYRPLISLHGSTCASGFPEPHHYLLRIHDKRPEDIRIGGLLFVGDLLSYRTEELMQRTESPGDPVAALRGQGVSFAVFSPGNYYLCPTLGEDLGRSVATYQAFVMQFGTSSMAYRVIDEQESQRYIASVLSASNTPKQMLDEATEIALMFNGKSAKLDLVAQEIADYQNGTLGQKERGLSIDMSAEWEFLVRNGMAALLMFQHKEHGIEPVSIFSDTLPRREQVPLVRWSDIRDRIPRAEIIEDMRALTEFHWGGGL